MDGVGMGGERTMRERIYVQMWLIHFVVWQKLTKHYKAIVSVFSPAVIHVTDILHSAERLTVIAPALGHRCLQDWRVDSGAVPPGAGACWLHLGGARDWPGWWSL